MKRRSATAACIMLLSLCIAACSGPREASREGPGGDVDRPVTRTVQGYRIQVLTTPDKKAADEEVERAIAWWHTLPERRRPRYLGHGELAVDIRWRQPYYRVRMGNFATRGEAEEALSVVVKRFPEAFIVPDTVTITR